jgi:hypothetical protein
MYAIKRKSHYSYLFNNLLDFHVNIVLDQI